MYSHRATHGPVDLAFTDRYGGASVAPYSELNLGLNGSGGDDPAAQAENHRRLIADFAPGDRVAALSQQHGRVVAVIGPEGPTTPIHPQADGVVTDQPGITLMVRAADCAPVLFADTDAQVIGAAHCGRAGLAAGVVPATVEAMRARGATDITAWLGPYVCGSCYEVPQALQDEVADQVPSSRATTAIGTPAIDIGAGIAAQLAALGVGLVDVSRCTMESPDLYSYRREGRHSGRGAGIIRQAAR